MYWSSDCLNWRFVFLCIDREDITSCQKPTFIAMYSANLQCCSHGGTTTSLCFSLYCHTDFIFLMAAVFSDTSYFSWWPCYCMGRYPNFCDINSFVWWGEKVLSLYDFKYNTFMSQIKCLCCLFRGWNLEQKSGGTAPVLFGSRFFHLWKTFFVN